MSKTEAQATWKQRNVAAQQAVFQILKKGIATLKM
jgi:hypothetical protein